jgi:hypothetical protein
MPAKLRAFISSTMEDLGNERRAVAARLRQLNIEPVNAEQLPPDGSSSWALLEDEIKSCQLFILISGQSYGWVPSAGPGSGGKRSVTHMESVTARKNGLIILPFFMALKAGEAATDDTKARDAFRKEIQNWEGGFFRQTFSWADELADRVGDSVSTVLGQALRRELQAKSAFASVEQAGFKHSTSERSGPKDFPPATDLHSIVAEAAWVSPTSVLLAGAGMSIAAGYPNALSLTKVLLDEMNISAASVDELTRHGFVAVAEIFEQKFGRETMIDRISGALLHSDAFGPTRAHIAAVRVFDAIVTTNLDLLFEAACRAVGIPCVVVSPTEPSIPEAAQDGLVIFKINGSIERPESLVFTKRDVAAANMKATWFWDSIKQRLAGNSLIVVGHALRDASAKLVPGAGVHAGGAYVTPFLSAADTLLLDRYNLTGVRADADSFMIAYEQAIAGHKKADRPAP